MNFSGQRTCGRPDSIHGCASVTYPVHGVKYSRVCWRMIAWIPVWQSRCFPLLQRSWKRTIDDHYLDGVSLTHDSSPRKHIWSFAAATEKARFTSLSL